MGRGHGTAPQRPGQRLLAGGAQTLADAELLALLLQRGRAGVPALALASELIAQFGDLAGVIEAEPGQLLAWPGVGTGKYAALRAALELARRHALRRIEGVEILSSPASTKRFLLHHLGNQPREIFCCLFLNNQHHVLRCEDLFYGTLDGAAVYPREVAVRALQYRAAAVILAHNHPSGVPEPSSADRRITERLVAALGLLDIRVLDHIVVGCGQALSFAEQGLL